MSWFTELEDVVYSGVDYIPAVGTLYSLARAKIAYKELDWTRHWQSVGNCLESFIRDVILLNELGEPVVVVLLHTVGESLTDKTIELYNQEPKKQVKINKKLDKRDAEYVLVTKSSMEKFESQVFRGKAKGVHHFQGAVFTGTLTDPNAPKGEKIRLDIPHGLYDGAQVTFSWKWTVDYEGKKNRPEITWGVIQLEAGTPTKFKLSSRKGASGWEGYDFKGQIDSMDQITATLIDRNREIVFKRVPRT